MIGWIILWLGWRRKIQSKLSLRGGAFIQDKYPMYWYVCVYNTWSLYFGILKVISSSWNLFLNIEWTLMEISDSEIKARTNYLDWRYHFLIIYFHILKDSMEEIKLINLGTFILVLLWHNSDPFYILRYVYFLTLVWFLMEVTNSSLETNNTTYTYQCLWIK